MRFFTYKTVGKKRIIKSCLEKKRKIRAETFVFGASWLYCTEHT